MDSTWIEWTVQGKVASISKTDNSHLAFSYDAFGNRVGKTVTLPGGLVTTTYYVRDAQGNVMAVYNGKQESASAGSSGYDHVITLVEQPIYGSSRIGMRLGNDQEVRRINMPLLGDPEVVFEGDYTYNILGHLLTTNISSEGAFLSGAKALPGISASLEALTADTYSISLFTDNATTYGAIEFNLLQNNARSIWSGEAASTGTWSHTITAGEESTAYQLSIRQKSSIFDQPIARQINGKQYEITDHLGNVRAVVGAGLDYNPIGKTVIPRDIATNTYYPFGMLIEALSTNSEGYRYGFNGKEKDDQGEWGMTAYDYGFRIYNPALARFLSVDPLTREYPWYSPYQFAGNMPIRFVDLDGLEPSLHPGSPDYFPRTSRTTSTFLEFGGGIGLSRFAKVYSISNGIARDKAGVTQFSSVGNMKSKEAWYYGVEFSAAFGKIWDNRPTFLGTIHEGALVYSPTGERFKGIDAVRDLKSLIKPKAGIGMTGSKFNFSLTGGMSGGFSYSALDNEFLHSISVTHSENDYIVGFAGVGIGSPRRINELLLEPLYSDGGEIIGLKSQLEVRNENNEWLGTGVTVFSFSKFTTSWFSIDYYNQAQELEKGNKHRKYFENNHKLIDSYLQEGDKY
jgi:RHS repeat-associated protein